MQSVSDYNANTRYFTPNILKYPGIAGQADIVSRESVKFPAIGSNFTSNNPTITIRVPAVGFLDPRTIFFRVKVSLIADIGNSVVVGSGLATDALIGGANGVLTTPLPAVAANTTNLYWSQAGIGSIFNGITLQTIDGTKIEEVPSNFNVLCGIQNSIVPPDYKSVLLNTESSYSQAVVLNTAAGANGAAGAYTQVGAAIATLGAVTYSFNPPLGLLNQVSAIPVELIGGLEFTFTLAPAANCFIYTPGTTATSVKNVNYTVQNIEMVADRLTLNNEYVTALTSHIKMNGLKLPYVTFRSNITQIPAGMQNAYTVNIADSANSVQCIYLAQIPTVVIGTYNTDSLVNYQNNNLSNYQYRIGGIYVPNYSISTSLADNGQAYIETIKCRGVYKTYLTGTGLDYNKTFLQIYGMNLEKSEDAMSGVATAGKQVDLVLNYGAPTAVINTLYTFMRIDAVLVINTDGSIRIMT